MSLRPYVPVPICPFALMSCAFCQHSCVLRPYVVDRRGLTKDEGLFVNLPLLQAKKRFGAST